MSAGKFVGEAAVAAIRSWNPFSPESYERRDRNKAYRKARRKQRRGESLTPEEQAIMAQETVIVTMPDGSTHERVEPVIKKRVSTKVTAVGLAFFAATAATVIPNWDAINAGLMAACQSEYGPAVGLGGMLAMLAVNAVTARVTKSPIKPGAI